jgi:hypothetical protein
VVFDHNLRHGDGMTLITVQDGTVVFRNGAVGTEQACCCKSCPPSGTVWYAYDLYSGCCFFPEDWDGVSPYDPATDPFPDRDCGDIPIGGQGGTLIGGPFRDQSECIDFYAGLGAQANRPGCVEGGRTCAETPCGENPLP